MPCQRPLLSARHLTLGAAVMVAMVLAAAGWLISKFTQSAFGIDPTATQTGRPESSRGIRLLFTGDVLLSRQVAAEIRQKRQSPWINLGDVFHSADWGAEIWKVLLARVLTAARRRTVRLALPLIPRCSRSRARRVLLLSAMKTITRVTSVLRRANLPGRP